MQVLHCILFFNPNTPLVLPYTTPHHNQHILATQSYNIFIASTTIIAPSLCPGTDVTTKNQKEDDSNSKQRERLSKRDFCLIWKKKRDRMTMGRKNMTLLLEFFGVQGEDGIFIWMAEETMRGGSCYFIIPRIARILRLQLMDLLAKPILARSMK